MQKHIFLLILASFHFGMLFCELAPLSSIPEELVNYFHPRTELERVIYPGRVELRQRRDLSKDDLPEETDQPNVFTVSQSNLDSGGKVTETKCMMIQTKIKIEIRYRLIPSGVGKRFYEMPSEPDKVNGTCALETDTSTMFIFWPGFNLSLVFTKNPEGNSYYMNRAVVVYDKQNPALKKDFSNSLRGGKVKLETIPDQNFFWTSLGKSYSCQFAEDQGPLKLFNVVDDEIEGTLEFSNTRFQPFVKRAGGVWGPGVECLPRSVRDTRDTMSFIIASLVLLVSGATVAGYGIQRTYFSDQKVYYDTYGEEKHEMQQMRENNEPIDKDEEVTEQHPRPQIKADSGPDSQGTANPFKQKSNPFQNYGST